VPESAQGNAVLGPSRERALYLCPGTAEKQLLSGREELSKPFSASRCCGEVSPASACSQSSDPARTPPAEQQIPQQLLRRRGPPAATGDTVVIGCTRDVAEIADRDGKKLHIAPHFAQSSGLHRARAASIAPDCRVHPAEAVLCCGSPRQRHPAPGLISTPPPKCPSPTACSRRRRATPPPVVRSSGAPAPRAPLPPPPITTAA
jgi:hypothetical protein